MDLLSQTLELHQQLRMDFQRREAEIATREAEARRVLEEILQKGAADRAFIQEERELLDGVEVVYRRFLDRQMALSHEVDHSTPVRTIVNPESQDTLLNANEAKAEALNVGMNETSESADAPWAARHYISEMASAITGIRAQRLMGSPPQTSDG